MMMLTSGGQMGDIARCHELGIAAYLVKPVTQSDLIDKIVQILDQSPFAMSASGKRRTIRVRTPDTSFISRRELNL